MNPEAPEFSNELYDKLKKRGLVFDKKWSPETKATVRGWQGISLLSGAPAETRKKRGLRISLDTLPQAPSFLEDTDDEF